MRVAHGRDQTSDADAVAAHDRVLALAVFRVVGHAHRLGVALAELEDVADLDAAAHL